MSDKITPTPLALLVQAEEAYGSHYIRAYVVIPQPNGELHNPSWWRFDDKASGRFTGFRINAYVGHPFMDAPDDKPGEVWGMSHEYVDVRIEDPDQAAEIAKVMRAIENGLRKIEDAEGYSNDLHVKIARIARILKIKDMYVRNLRKAAAMSGEDFRKVSGSALQSWISHVSDLAGERKWHEVISR